MCVCVIVAAAVPVSDVFVASMSGDSLRRVTESDNNPVRLREQQQHGIACITVLPSASVSPTLRVIVTGTDWTHLFVESETMHSLPAANDSVTPPVSAVFRLVYVTMKPERRFNGHILECSATSDGFLPVSASAPVIIECRYSVVAYMLSFLYCSLLKHAINMLKERGSIHSSKHFLDGYA